MDNNLGFAKANNLAAKRARADYLIMLNPDAFAYEDWLEKLLAEVCSPDITMVGSLQYMAGNCDILDGAGDFYHISGIALRGGFGHPASRVHDAAFEVFAPCGAGALYHRGSYLAVGGFDERFFCYHEDVDLGYRLRLAGGRCVQSVSARLDHVGSAISGRRSDFSIYHGTRNRIWTFAKNTPARFLWFFAPLHILVNLLVLLRAALRRGTFGPTWRGIGDGIKGLPKIWVSRKVVKAQRKISPLKMLGIYTWSPIRVVRRSVPTARSRWSFAASREAKRSPSVEITPISQAGISQAGISKPPRS